MDVTGHKDRHIMLHKYLDELIADFIANTKKYDMSKITVKDLMDWSSRQIEKPDEYV